MNQLSNKKYDLECEEGKLLLMFLVFGATESNIEEQENNQEKSKGDKNINIYLGKLTHLFPLLSSQKAINKQTIAPVISSVKVILSLIVERSEKFGKIKAAPIQPAVKFVKRADSTLRLEVVKSFFNFNKYNRLGEP